MLELAVTEHGPLGNVPVIGHAMDQCAIALACAKAIGIPQIEMQKILSINQDTASAVMLTASTVQYITTESKAGSSRL